MITIEELIQRVNRELRGELASGTTLDEHSSLKELGVSSLQVAEIVFSLEEDYDVQFDDAGAADVKTLGDLVTLVNDALVAAAPAPMDAERV